MPIPRTSDSAIRVSPHGPLSGQRSVADSISDNEINGGRSLWIDSVLWFLVTGIVITIVPIGWVNGNALYHAGRYAGSWVPNPNHLLFEPVGAWWMHTLTRLGSQRPGADQLTLLSAWSGALSLALFRLRLHRFVGSSRASANFATLCLALSVAWTRHLVTGNHFMVDMPFLVLSAMAAIDYGRTQRLRFAIAAGAWAGAAALFLISNLVFAAFAVGVAFAIWHAVRREWRLAIIAPAAIGLSAAIVAGVPLGLTYVLQARSGMSPLAWLTTYSGGTVAERAIMRVGVNSPGQSVLVAMFRAAYGVICALVDVQPVVQVFRDQLSVTPRVILNAAAVVVGWATCAYAYAELIRLRAHAIARATALFVAAWIVGTFLLGVYINIADDEYYFHLAACFGLIAAAAATMPMRRRGAVLVLAASVLAFNAYDVIDRVVLFPRWERVASLNSALAGTGLIVSGGENEVETVIFFADTALRRRWYTIIGLASKAPQDSGMKILADRVRATLDSGKRVDVVDVFDTAPKSLPWKALRRMEYEKDSIIAVLERLGVEPKSRYVGPYTLRSIYPSQPATVPRK